MIISLSEIPPSVLLEIFFYLAPVDLLYLSRVSKHFWKTLTSKVMVQVWKSAYNNLELPFQPPSCPNSVAEPYWVQLLFTDECSICGQNTKCRSADWNNCLRPCRACFETHYKPSTELATTLPQLDGIDMMTWVPPSNFRDLSECEPAMFYSPRFESLKAIVSVVILSHRQTNNVNAALRAVQSSRTELVKSSVLSGRVGKEWENRCRQLDQSLVSTYFQAQIQKGRPFPFQTEGPTAKLYSTPKPFLERRKWSKGTQWIECQPPFHFSGLGRELQLHVSRYLPPLGLLFLSRTSKKIKFLLTSKIQRPLWQTAFENLAVDYPRCPSWITEILWTRILFTAECTLCGSDFGQPSVDWNNGLRSCKGCFELFYSSEPELVAADALAFTILPLLAPSNSSGHPEFPKMYYNVAFSAMRFQIAMHNQIRKHGVDNDLDISTFVLEKKRKVQEMLRFGQTAKELGALQNCRGAAQSNKGAEVSARDELKKSKPRKRVRSEAYTNKSIRRAKAAEAFTEWLRQNPIPEGVFIPTTQELCDWEPIRALIVNHPPSQAIRSELFIEAMTAGQSFLKGYDYKVRVRLLDQINAAQELPKSDSTTITEFAPLYLATSVFACSEGRLRDGPPLHWVDEHVAMHLCAPGNMEIYRDTARARTVSTCFTFDTITSRGIEDIVRAVGLDPMTTTVSEMDQLDARFRCNNCPSGDSVIRSWRNCAAHVRYHVRLPVHSWAVLKREERDAAITLELQNPYERPRFLCKVCLPSEPLIREALPSHFATIHSMEADGSYWKEVLSIPPTPVSLTMPHYSYSLLKNDVGGRSRWICHHCSLLDNQGKGTFSAIKELKDHMKTEHYVSRLTLDDVGRTLAARC